MNLKEVVRLIHAQNMVDGIEKSKEIPFEKVAGYLEIARGKINVLVKVESSFVLY